MDKDKFIQKAKEVHGDKYDYSLVPDSWKSSEKITLLCEKHGEFSITVSNHINNRYGCPLCRKEKAALENKSLFIRRGVEKFGNTFDYSFVEYITAKHPVKLACIKHNTYFHITPDAHLSKSAHGGCPQCKKDYEDLNNLERNAKLFLDNATALHGDKYDYSLVNYRKAKSKVKIRCIKHDLVFETTPDVHSRKNKGNGGCPACHKEVAGQYHRLSVEDFVKRAKAAHNNQYNYDLITEFKNAHTKVPILCLDHGVFHQTVSNHLYNGFGCPTCANVKMGLSARLSQDEFVSRSKQIYGDRFDYSEVVYEGYYKQVKIFCNEHQEYFYQQPANHFHGVGCRDCIDKGYSRDKSGYIYINKVTDEVVKVGITNVCPVERAKVISRKSKHDITNLFYFYHEDGDFIYKLEQHILKTYPAGIISKEDMLSGYTETVSVKYLPEIIDTIVYHFTNNTS